MSEQTTISSLIANKERGSFIQMAVDLFGNSLSFSTLEALLTKTIMEACRESLPLLEKGFIQLFARRKMTTGRFSIPKPPTKNELIDILAFHSKGVLENMTNRFADDSITCDRLTATLEDPQLVGLRNFSFSSAFHAGKIYALFWYAITGSEPDWDTCTMLDMAHVEMIQNELERIDEVTKMEKRLTGRNKRRSSFHPFVVGLTILVIVLAVIALIHFL